MKINGFSFLTSLSESFWLSSGAKRMDFSLFFSFRWAMNLVGFPLQMGIINLIIYITF